MTGRFVYPKRILQDCCLVKLVTMAYCAELMLHKLGFCGPVERGGYQGRCLQGFIPRSSETMNGCESQGRIGPDSELDCIGFYGSFGACS